MPTMPSTEIQTIPTSITTSPSHTQVKGDKASTSCYTRLNKLITVEDRPTKHSLILTFFVAIGLFNICVLYFPLGELYPEHSQLSFDCVLIAYSLESIIGQV